jgi:hypothetical protein
VVRLAVAALALAIALAVPVRLSADVWAYAAYGALVADGADPYAHAYRAADVAMLHDPLVDAALREWDGSLPRDVYGLAFTLPCAAVVALTRPFGTAAPIVTLRLLAALALLGCIALAGRLRLGALLAYHPVVLWSAAEGHNDAWWLALVLLAHRFRAPPPRLALLVAAVAVKAIALPALVAALLPLPRRRLVVAAAACGAALALAYAPLGWSVIAHGLDHATGPPRISLLHAAGLARWSGSTLPVAIAVALAALAGAGVARAFRGGDRLAAATLLGWLLLPAPEPWYATWLVPVVAVVRPSPAAWALLAASLTGSAAYLQDLPGGTALHGPALLGGIMLALYALPVLIAALAPSPAGQAPPTPPPLVAPSPAATALPSPVATAQPATPAPTLTPSPVPASTTTPNPFGYIVSPSPPPAGAPRIIEVALNDKVLRPGGLLLVRVTTSPEITKMVVRTMGREIGIPLASPGVFAGQQQIPNGGIPSYMLNRTYQCDFVGTTADGRTAVATLPIRFER